MSSLFLPFQYDYNDTIPEVFCLSCFLISVLKLTTSWQTLYSEVVAQARYIYTAFQTMALTTR